MSTVGRVHSRCRKGLCHFNNVPYICCPPSVTTRGRLPSHVTTHTNPPSVVCRSSPTVTSTLESHATDSRSHLPAIGTASGNSSARTPDIQIQKYTTQSNLNTQLQPEANSQAKRQNPSPSPALESFMLQEDCVAGTRPTACAWLPSANCLRLAAFCSLVGTWTSHARPTACSSLMRQKVVSNSHHSSPCAADHCIA